MKILSFPARMPNGGNPYHETIFNILSSRHEVLNYSKLKPWQTADIFHIHWLEFLLRGKLADANDLVWEYQCWNVLQTISRVKKSGGIVWTVHNISPHESFQGRRLTMWRKLQQAVLPQIDVAIAMSANQIPLLRKSFPNVSEDAWYVASHPHVRGVYPRVASNAPSQRDLLNIPKGARVVCMIGLVRPYKGIVEAARVFINCSKDNEYLIIAGACRDPKLERELRELLGGYPRVRLELSPLSPQRFAALHSVSDLALFNFKESLNSGSIMTALSLDVRVLAPSSLFLEDIREHVGSWAESFDGSLRPELLRAKLDKIFSVRPESERPNLNAFEPALVAEQHEIAYRAALRKSKARQGSRD